MNSSRFFFSGRNVLRTLYAQLLSPQYCLLCGKVCGTGLPVCSHCVHMELMPYISSAVPSSYEGRENRCLRCGKILISESSYCTSCRSINEHSEQNIKNFFCTRVFTLFPYIGLGQKLLPAWKNHNIRSFSTVFSPLICKFIMQHTELQGLPLVPIPPRPKKLQEKGWDQIEDLGKELAQFKQITVFPCLKRQDGTPQKKLSKKQRAVNLQGKIHVTTQSIPEKVILLDDVMTTGATLEACAAALKKAGCNQVYGLCLFFD